MKMLNINKINTFPKPLRFRKRQNTNYYFFILHGIQLKDRRFFNKNRRNILYEIQAIINTIDCAVTVVILYSIYFLNPIVWRLKMKSVLSNLKLTTSSIVIRFVNAFVRSFFGSAARRKL